jgi:hypothetical protein
MKDGLVLFYCKDGVIFIYPIALNEDQQQTLEFMSHLFAPIKIINKPQGPAIYLRGDPDGRDNQA